MLCDWKIGDEIRCIDDRLTNALLKKGQVYKVKNVTHSPTSVSMDYVYVGTIGQDGWPFRMFELASKSTESKIKVGRIVEILRDNPSASGLKKGDICKVTKKEDPVNGLTQLRVDNKWWVRTTDVKLVREEPKEGTKFDEDKLRYDLLSPYAIEELVKVLTFGAKKYGDRNWEKGLKWSRVFAALMRHLWAYWRGRDSDEEWGLSPLAHAMCCCMFLLHYTQTRKEFDDRPKGGK